jgi:UDP-GlcNAc:undecaprenyl-phosphate GlcNAc-1-phosphate transferase
MALVLPALLSLLVTTATLPLLMTLAVRYGGIDQPGGRKEHARPVPRVGGIAIACGGAVACVAAGALGRTEWVFLSAAAVIVLFGAIDDWFDLDYRAKFSGQFVAALTVMIGGGVAIRTITLDAPVALPPAVSYATTALFLIGITNAINMTDGLDGLAGGTTFLCLAALALLGATGGQWGALVIAVSFAAAVLGFLRFNTYPAVVFMGDAGSQLLGFTVGVVAILVTQAPGAVVSASIPVLLLGIPILDTLLVITQRLREGRSPFRADRNHLHYRLLGLGLDHHEAVAVIYSVQTALFICAYYLRYESDLVIVGVFAAFCALVLVPLELSLRHHWRLRQPTPTQHRTPLARALGRLTRPAGIPRWSLIATSALMLVQGALTVFQTQRLPSDFVLPASVIAGLLGISLVLRARQPLRLAEKAVLYVAAALVVVVDALVARGVHRPLWLEWGLPLALAASTAICLRLSADRRFTLTPLDIIVLFVALVVPNLAGPAAIPTSIATTIAKAVIVFYGLELLANRLLREAVWLRVGALALVLALLGRGMIVHL